MVTYQIQIPTQIKFALKVFEILTLSEKITNREINVKEMKMRKKINVKCTIDVWTNLIDDDCFCKHELIMIDLNWVSLWNVVVTGH